MSALPERSSGDKGDASEQENFKVSTALRHMEVCNPRNHKSSTAGCGLMLFKIKGRNRQKRCTFCLSGMTASTRSIFF